MIEICTFIGITCVYLILCILITVALYEITSVRRLTVCESIFTGILLVLMIPYLLLVLAVLGILYRYNKLEESLAKSRKQ